MAAMRTLQEIRDTDHLLLAYCAHDFRCSHAAELDLGLLIARLGPAFALIGEPVNRHWLCSRLRCSKCGRYYPALQVGLPPKKTTGVGGAHGSSPTAIAGSGIDYGEALERAIRFRREHPPENPPPRAKGRGRYFGR